MGEKDGDKGRRGGRVEIFIPKPGPPFSSDKQLTRAVHRMHFPACF